MIVKGCCKKNTVVLKKKEGAEAPSFRFTRYRTHK